MQNLSKICIDDISIKNVRKINTAFYSIALFRYVKKIGIEIKMVKIIENVAIIIKLVNQHHRSQVQKYFVGDKLLLS